MSINYKEKAILGIYWMGFMSISNIIMKLLITMVLSRLLSSYEFGVVAAIQIVISFADIFWMLGVGTAIVQKNVLSNDDITTGNTLNIVFGLSIYGVIFVFASAIANFIGLENIVMLRVLALVFVIHSISGVSESLLQKDMNFKTIGIINVLSLLIYGILASLLALLNFGVWSLIIAQLLQVLVKTILSLIKRPIKVSLAIKKQSAKELMYFGTGFTLSKIFNNIANQGDYFVVNRTLGVSALGFYNRSYQLLMIPTNIIGTVMDQVLFPLLSKYQETNEKLRYVFFNINSIIALIAFPVTIISLTMSTELVHIVLGYKWDSTILPFRILIISLFFRMAYKICDSLVRSLGAVYKRLWIQIVYAVTIIAGAFLGKEWGINGVAVAVTIAIIINYILMTLLIMRMIKFKITNLLRYLLPIIVVSILIGGLSYLITPLIMNFSGAILRLVIITLFVTLLYLLSFKYIIIRILPSDFNEFVVTVTETTLKKIKLKKTK